MDKLLDFVVAYIKEIFDKAEINWKQLILLLIVFSFLSFVAIYGYLNKWENNVLKSMAEFSFYTCVVMILLWIIWIWWRNKEMGKFSDYIKIFKRNKSKNLVNYFNEEKKILVIFQKQNYEINIRLYEDEYFWSIYVYFDSKELLKTASKIDILSDDFIKNWFEDCLNYKENRKLTTPDSIKEAVNKIREELEKIDN